MAAKNVEQHRAVEQHQAIVAELIGTMPVESLPLAECLGLVSATALRAAISLPPFDNSAMDGYAVRSVDVAGASASSPVELPVAEDVPAGRSDLVPLLPGTAHRIMTGAPLPPGADAVVQVELTDAGTERVRISAEVGPGRYLRRTGEDVRAGSVVLPAGTVLGAPQLGVAAAVGVRELAVRRRPRVLVLSTGSELAEPGTPLAPGQIYESNGTMLAAAVRASGGEATLLKFVHDDVDTFRAALAPHLAGVDLVVTSGGASAGAYEVVKDALSGHGVTFAKVAVQPGGPQGAGRYQGVPFVTLPGNPVSAHVSFEVFLRPALRASMGHQHPERPVVTARLSAELSSPPQRRQFLRGHFDPATGTVEQVGGPGSHLLAALARADCLLVVPEDVTALPAGAEVTVIPLAAG